MIDSTSRIAELNDLCRKAFGLAGRVFQTEGIAALSQRDQSAIREKVELFDSFTEDNDPHGEHDFGAFEHEGQRIFWKIDYYAPDMEHGSENPADPKQTVRVLTIMLASEY
jgi:PAS domain-containing protein